MKFRSVGKILSAFIFTISLSTMMIFISLAEFTSYSNLKPVMTKVIASSFSDSLSQQISTIERYCKNREKLEIVVGEKNFTINCSTFKKETILDEISSEYFDQIYFKEYECEFIDCFRLNTTENFMILISKKGNELYIQARNWCMLVAILSGLFLFLSTKNWEERFKVFGSSFIFVGLPLFTLKYLSSQIISFFNIKTEEMINLVQHLFSPLNLYYKVFLSVGVVLLGIGYCISYYRKKH